MKEPKVIPPNPSAEQIADFARGLPQALRREHELLAALYRLGISEDELRVLEGDEHLLKILAEESAQGSTEEARRELLRVLRWHEARLSRVAEVKR
jgi:hypothetical protein